MSDSIKTPTLNGKSATKTAQNRLVEHSDTIPGWFALDVLERGDKALCEWLKANAPPHIQRLAERMANLRYFIGSAGNDDPVDGNATETIVAVVNSMNGWSELKGSWRNPEA